jgi:hypothetical protein
MSSSLDVQFDNPMLEGDTGQPGASPFKPAATSELDDGMSFSMDSPMVAAAADDAFGGDTSPRTPDLDLGAQRAAEYKTNTVDWLQTCTERSNARIASEQLNYKFDAYTRTQKDLGDVSNSWAFVFHMGRQDDGPSGTDAQGVKHEYETADKIPLQAWQLCHRMWKQDFSLHYSFSTTGEYIIVALGLPYKVLVQEASAISINMRMRSTKGSHPFKEEMIERYPDFGHCGCFNSALRQGLCLARLKRKAKIFPETIGMTSSKSAAFKPVRSLFKHKHAIRGRTLYKMFDAFGCYRPNAGAIFGDLVKRVALYVMQDEWVTFEHPERVKKKGQSLMAEAHSHQDAGGLHVRYSDIGRCVQTLESWMQGPGEHERFNGEFAGYFALHHKPTIADFRNRWGRYDLIWKSLYIMDKDGEEISTHAMHHPDNHAQKQIAMLYQPIDEIRDYFGDHVALYFAWLGLYTQKLVFPTIFGILGMISQWIAGNNPDDNPTTTPYSVFFAAWSISFLSSWTRKESELKFLWGSEGFEVKERPRPEFVGLHVINPETRRDEVVYTGSFLRAIKITISFCISWVFIGFTIYCAIWASSLKDDHKLTPNEMIGSCCGEDVNPHDDSTCCGCWKLPDGCPADMIDTFTNVAPQFGYAYVEVSNGTWINPKGCFIPDVTTEDDCALAGLTGTGGYWIKSNLYENFKWMGLSAALNLTIIVVYGVIYEKIAELLSNWENHKTLTEWEDSVVIKNFMFQFINNYFVLFYISYLRPFLTNCQDETQGGGEFCKASDLPELQFQLLIVFTGKTLGWRAGEIITPKAQTWLAETMKVRRIMQVMNKVESMAASVEHKISDMEESVFGTSLEKAYGQLDDIEHDEDEMEARILADIQRENAATVIQKHTRGMFTRRTLATDLELSARVQGGKQPGQVFEKDPPEDATVGSDSIPPAADSSSSKAAMAAQKLSKKELKQKLADHYADDRNVEDEFTMVEFESSFDEFNEMAVQYGYLALFAPAYPLAPLLAFINNVFEIRIDAVKFCTVLQRPRFRQAEDIGAWYTVLNVLGFFAVITNASMIAFVGSQMADDDEVGGAIGWRTEEDGTPAAGQAGIAIRIKSQKMWVVMVLIEHAVMLMRVLILSLSPAVPDWIKDAKDTLQFRLAQWESGIDAMYSRDGVDASTTMQDIHVTTAQEEASIKTTVKPPAHTMLKSMLALPLKALPGDVPMPKLLDTNEHEEQGEAISRFEMEAIKEEAKAFKSSQSAKKLQRREAKGIAKSAKEDAKEQKKERKKAKKKK